MLLASVADGRLNDAAGLLVNGNSSFFTSATSLFPNDHAPVKDGVSDFLFYDIGDFTKNPGVVPDFADGTGAADGEIKTLALSGMGNLDWIHFDVLALETHGGIVSLITTLTNTDLENNPGSHDVTWKNPNPIPEPATIALLGIGLAGLAGGAVRRRFKRVRKS